MLGSTDLIAIYSYKTYHPHLRLMSPGQNQQAHNYPQMLVKVETAIAVPLTNTKRQISF